MMEVTCRACEFHNLERQHSQSRFPNGEAMEVMRSQHMQIMKTESAIILIHRLRSKWGIWMALAGAVLMVGCAGTSADAPERPKPGIGRFFVATNGNDQWSGLLPEPNGARTDGPFQGIRRALEASRAHPASVGEQAIYLRQGVYFLAEPLHFTAADSGLLISGYGGEHPVISGGQRVTGWRESDVSGRKVWLAEVPSWGQTQSGTVAHPPMFHQIWVNGRRAVRARHPNQGYLKVAAVQDATKEWTQGQSRFQFFPDDLKPWLTITQAEVVVMSRWVESRLPVTKVDPGTKSVTFSKRSVFQLGEGDQYYLEGALEALDEPGEWFLDFERGLLHYIPRPGEKLQGVDVIVPRLPQLASFDGSAAQPIQNLRLVNIDFSHTEWYFPSGFEGDSKRQVSPAPEAAVGGFAQAAIGVPGAIVGEYVRDCSMDRCGFTHLGGYGLELARGCQRNTIRGCEFSDLGAGGLRLGEAGVREDPQDRAGDNTVVNSRFFEGGRLFHSAIGIWIGQSPGNKLLHNEIHDFYYTGISVGWTWGYGPALATNTLVAFNHVHHIGVQSNGDGPILSDMGGIYTLGRHDGSLILNNLWHDISAVRYGGWGIYFDEGTSGMRAISNVVYRTTHGGFHQHYGATNHVYNNIFAQAVEHQIQRSRAEPHPSFTFATNIVYFNQGVVLGGNWDGDHFMMDRNLFFDARVGSAGGQMKFPGGSLQQWRDRKHDQNSIIEDPLFLNPSKGDFTLRKGSPAFRLGFQPIQLDQVGPQR